VAVFFFSFAKANNSRTLQTKKKQKEGHIPAEGMQAYNEAAAQHTPSIRMHACTCTLSLVRHTSKTRRLVRTNFNVLNLMANNEK
jgi:hypothetical protein